MNLFEVLMKCCTALNKKIFSSAELVGSPNRSLSKFSGVTHKSTVARTVMCRQDGRGRFPVLLDDHSKCRTNSQRKSQLS